MTDFCCKQFRDKYADSRGGFEYNEACEDWNVTGCCGGCCYVLIDIKFCPFCGKELEEPEDLDENQ